MFMYNISYSALVTDLCNRAIIYFLPASFYAALAHCFYFYRFDYWSALWTVLPTLRCTKVQYILVRQTTAG